MTGKMPHVSEYKSQHPIFVLVCSLFADLNLVADIGRSTFFFVVTFCSIFRTCSVSYAPFRWYLFVPPDVLCHIPLSEVLQFFPGIWPRPRQGLMMILQEHYCGIPRTPPGKTICRYRQRYGLPCFLDTQPVPGQCIDVDEQNALWQMILALRND